MKIGSFLAVVGLFFALRMSDAELSSTSCEECLEWLFGVFTCSKREGEKVRYIVIIYFLYNLTNR